MLRAFSVPFSMCEAYLYVCTHKRNSGPYGEVGCEHPGHMPASEPDIGVDHRR